MTNRYTFLSRKSMKPARIGSAPTREDARRVKRRTDRDVVIFDRINQQVVR